jgi:hypothetical protein
MLAGIVKFTVVQSWAPDASGIGVQPSSVVGKVLPLMTMVGFRIGGPASCRKFCPVIWSVVFAIEQTASVPTVVTTGAGIVTMRTSS